MELKMNEYQLPEKISFNYQELKQELTEKLSVYSTMVYTDDQIKLAKADKANLNKLKNALNDERIRREKEYMVPFNAFKAQVNEIIAIIDKPVAVIDQRVKEFEEQKKQDKLAAIKDAFNAMCSPDWLKFEQLFDEKWLNASTSMTKVIEEITLKIEKIDGDILTLSDLPEFGFEAKEVYKSTLDLNKAIAEGHRLSEIQKQKAAYEAEQARLKAEEEARKNAFQADAMNPPVEEQKQEAFEPKRSWVAFQALMTYEDAMELKKFFIDRNIEFKAV